MKRDHWVILLAFFGGIVCANLLDAGLLTTYGVLNDYFLEQYSYRTVDGNRLFCQAALLRGKSAFIIFLLGRVLEGRIFRFLLEGMIGFTFGFLVVVSIVNLGVKGLAVCLVGMFPQWFFYLFALSLYCAGRQSVEMAWEGAYHREEIPIQLMRSALILLLLVLGVIMESYVNPILFTYMLNFF